MTTDLAQDLAALHEATERLIAAAGKLDDADVARPSLLPGWTRGHVLTHIARNADALVNVLAAARTGRTIPMYASAEARDRDIEAGSTRPLAEQLDDVSASASRFNDAAASLHPEHWSRTVELRGGVTDLASRLPFRRLTEVELHHVDLGTGFTVEGLSPYYTGRELEFLAEQRFAGQEGVPALVLVATTGEPGGREWRTGRAGGEPVRVSGSPAALVGWLTGRTDGTGLRTGGGSALPALPPLG